MAVARSALVLTLFLFAACGASTSDDPEVARILGELADDYTLAEIELPLHKGSLGGLNMWAYCLSEGYPAVGYRKGTIEGEGAAWDNWVCQQGSEQLAPVGDELIDLDEACRWQFGRPDVVARPDDENHAWSWGCFAV